MALLWDKYNNILNNRSDWCYYMNSELQFDNSIFTDKYSANNFIREYFDAGEKEVFKVGTVNLDSYHKRNLHTVSLYFLGLYIAKELGVNKFASRNYMKELNETKYKRFLFDWFLTCLYHDIGYQFEEQSDNNTNVKTLSSFLELNKINEERDIDSLFGEKGLFFKNRKLFDLCNRYYSYIYNNFGKIEHGITGGIILYNKLYNNYFNHKKELNENRDSFIHNGLCFSTKLFTNYKNAAKAIIKHNMWIANSRSINNYIDNELFNLIPKEIDNSLLDSCNKINKQVLTFCKAKGEFTKYGIKDKLTFLLCLADTLEPIKSFNDKTENFNNEIENTLKNIDITISSGIIKIKVNSSLSPNEYFKKIKSLEEWMNIKVIDSSNFYDNIDNKSYLKIILEQTI